MSRPTLRVLTNIDRLAKGTLPDVDVECTVIDISQATTLLSSWQVFKRSRSFDVMLIDGMQRPLMLICFFRWLIPWGNPKLVSVDLLLNKPERFSESVYAFVRRLLFHRIDLFIHYFKDFTGYAAYFGIGDNRSVYVPFKVNQKDKVPAESELQADGDYVLTSGRSMRDFKTFVAAMEKTQLPGVLLYFDSQSMHEHGARWVDDLHLPTNVAPTQDDGSIESFFAFIRNAKVVVIPLLPESIRAVGISMYLVAMALKKCVVITKGPATDNILTDQAIIVPPSDPLALASAIKQVWNDDQLRDETAQKGYDYAMSLGGEERLYSDFLSHCQRIVAK